MNSMPSLHRTYLAQLIVNRIIQEKDRIKTQYEESKNQIGYFYIDDLLSAEITEQIDSQFPSKQEMVLKKSIRENKYIGVQMNEYAPVLEELIYAFQDDRVVNLIKQVCGIQELTPDENLYAGGLSSMKQSQFLNPHLDNSHDKERNRWRVLNLLFYVTPNWKDSNGGHLEIWPEGLDQHQTTLHSRFNRLIVMATHDKSWHSVSPVVVNASRNCVSNYYFSNTALSGTDKFHVTTFRGRPHQKFKNHVLRFDSFLRMNLRKIFKKGVVKNPHVYKSNKD
ncbi:2OG-Fe(II) oxygenase [Flavobacteriaceae bacterium]|jgi:Rps23 Pro-64 3,4-dihydroxylase Tpa1-like proline 4-hydroxylase|nr:2OG-Fe(II) oxygenase [Flavobacteriaceae bacterium]MDA7727379.1 2OG-Fe(II) oxygenase [Flavobacteriaceae bacterium]MDA7849496.1 2OG-Fe(II) oxygenase [Flavobacteriaceae bacterium]